MNTTSISHRGGPRGDPVDNASSHAPQSVGAQGRIDMNSRMTKTLIVGAGQGGAEVAASLRQQGYGGRILLVGEEAALPYRRPPLSKAYMLGEDTSDSLLIRPRVAYDKAGIELLIPGIATRIDRQERRVVLADGRVESYDKLVLATGGRPRRLALPGADAPNVLYLRTVADADRIRAALGPSKRMIVIGGGYIGLEMAAAGVKAGTQVTVLESAERILIRVTAPVMSAFYKKMHSEAGVHIRTSARLKRLEVVAGRIVAVELDDGTHIPADFMVVGIGLLPNVELARDAGLEVGDGIAVDEFGRTSDTDIFAIGDCALQVNAFFGRAVRVESVPSATEQARTVAATICGKPQPHRAVPWFWSDQYKIKLQMVGLSQGYDCIVIRGDPAARSFCAFYLRDRVIIAVDAVNRPAEFMIAKRLVSERVIADATQLAGEQPLQTMLDSSLRDKITPIG